jgi:hypothetical protein
MAMTRSRNSAFVGSSVLDVDLDAPMYTRTLMNAALDYHLLYDATTGENAIVSPLMTHNGAGLGSPLGLSIVSQAINKRLGFSVVDIDTYNQDNIIMWAAMIRIPGGETRNISVMLDLDRVDGSQTFWAELFDDTATLLEQCSITGPFQTLDGPLMHQGILPASGNGVWRMLLIRTNIPADTPGWCQLRNVYVGPQVYPMAASDGRVPGGVNAYPVPVAGVGESVRTVPIHDSVIDQNGRAINGWVLTKMNQNLTAFHEFLTGAPVPGNATLSNTDNATTRPTTPRFSSRTQRVFTAEPLVPFPLMCEGLGAIGWDGTALQPIINSGATEGSTTWFAPYPTATGTTQGQQICIYGPDLPSSSGTGNLVCKVLVCETGALKLTSWQCRINNPAVGASAWFSPAYLGSSMFAVITITDVPFTRDDNNTLTLQSQKTAGSFGFGQFFVLGWTFAFDT